MWGGARLSAPRWEGTAGTDGRVCNGVRAGGKPSRPCSCPASALSARGRLVSQEPHLADEHCEAQGGKVPYGLSPVSTVCPVRPGSHRPAAQPGPPRATLRTPGKPCSLVSVSSNRTSSDPQVIFAPGSHSDLWETSSQSPANPPLTGLLWQLHLRRVASNPFIPKCPREGTCADVCPAGAGGPGGLGHSLPGTTGLSPAESAFFPPPGAQRTAGQGQAPGVNLWYLDRRRASCREAIPCPTLSDSGEMLSFAVRASVSSSWAWGWK